MKNLQIAKWGNSLALRIPAEYARNAGIEDGDQVEVSMTVDGGFCVRVARWDRKAFVRKINKFLKSMPVSDSVMEELRSGARY
jgi:antitoxin MazE